MTSIERNRFPRYKGLKRGSRVELWEISRLFSSFRISVGLGSRNTLQEIAAAMPDQAMENRFYCLGDLISDLAYDIYANDVSADPRIRVRDRTKQTMINSRKAVFDAVAILAKFYDNIDRFPVVDGGSHDDFIKQFETITQSSRLDTLACAELNGVKLEDTWTITSGYLTA